VPVTRLASFQVERVEVLDPEGRVDEALMPPLTDDDIRRLYRIMVLTRQADDRMLKLQRQGRLGTFARVMGQEGAHVPAALAMKDDDWLVPAFRETGAYLQRGLPLEKLLQFWSGDERGFDAPGVDRLLPIAVPVGTHMLHAVGIGWAMQREAEGVAVLTFFGEGATSEGDFSEAMNFAGVFQTPVVFVCQNNQWAISVPYARQTAACTVAQKAVAYGMPGVQVDGNDPFAVYRMTREALERARQGGGPTLVEALTYRVTDHTTSDDARRYRTDEEVQRWVKRDPLRRLALFMKAHGLLDEAEEETVLADADRQVAEAVARFEVIEPPGAEEIFAHVFADLTTPLAEQRAGLLRRLGEGG
jgi:pyruvate dehydrogenase E1 component alpha subunit